MGVGVGVAPAAGVAVAAGPAGSTKDAWAVPMAVPPWPGCAAMEWVVLAPAAPVTASVRVTTAPAWHPSVLMLTS